MLTIRQVEKLWQAKEFSRLVNLLLETRPEASLRLRHDLARDLPVAALVVIRLDELNQAHVPLCAQMIRTILAGQEPDGGWGDPLTTALCLRALRCSHGEGPSIDRGWAYLASLQRADGAWPRVPMRRMPADPFVSALILYLLTDDGRFTQQIDLPRALAWLESQPLANLDPETARLWRSIARRRRAHSLSAHLAPATWS